jgi:hypothetical protein
MNAQLFRGLDNTGLNDIHILHVTFFNGAYDFAVILLQIMFRVNNTRTIQTICFIQLKCLHAHP